MLHGSTSDPECVTISVMSCHALLTLVQALVFSKVDYCNSVLISISGQLQDWLQSVLNAATCLVFSPRWSDYITPLHCSVSSTGWEFQSGSHSGLLLSSWNSAILPCWEPSRDIWRQHLMASILCWHSHAGGIVHQTLNAWWPCTGNPFFGWLQHVHGTACRHLVRMRHHTNWRLYFLGRHFTLIQQSWLYCRLQLLTSVF